MQQIGWQTDRQRGQLIALQLTRCQQIAGDVLPEQQGQRIAILRDLACVLFDADPRRVHGTACLAEIERRGDADVEAVLRQTQALLVGLESVATDLQQGLIGL